MIPKRYFWLVHITGCLVFLSVPFFTSPHMHGNGLFGLSIISSRDLIQFSLLILFFYLNYYLLIPRLFFTKKYLWYALILLASMWLIAYIPQVFDSIPEPPQGFKRHAHFGARPPRMRNFFFVRINHNFFLFLAVAFFSLLLRISNRWKRTEKEKLNAELSYLKAQINPHFLFNTLNSIYSLAIQKADATAPAVQKLSAMMRYVLNESMNDFVPLQKEIEYISNYIDLQKLRFGKEMELSYSISGHATDEQISPLILIPFIENAFKYGVNAEAESIILIHINISQHQLQMMVTNNKVRSQVSDENQSGIGVTNTRERLNLIYPGKHRLQIADEEKKYTVTLNIQLQ